MKKFTFLMAGILLASSIFAGGLKTNTNQSAAWSRMLIRDASIEIDAVYFNPAGLVKLQDGFHISLSNQSIFQTQTINSTYPMNTSEFIGDVSAPFFPSLYLAYKTGRWAFSAGLNVIGGGGGAKFDKGVPMMEIPIASLVPSLSSVGVTGYSVDMSFEGRSVYWGIQAGASFAVTDNISLFAGARYVMAKNTYTGYLKNVMVTTPAGELPPDTYVQGLSDQAAAGAVSANAGGDAVQPIIDGGGGTYTLTQLLDFGFITEAEKAQLEGGLLQLGFTQEQVDAMSAQELQGSYYTAATGLTETSQYLAQQAAYLGIVTADQDADITQKGSGITPIVGANFSFLEGDLNIGAKYEFKTKLELKNSTPEGKGFITGVDETGKPTEMFPNDSTTHADMPAMLSVGVDYRIIDPLLISVGYHAYFDKQTEQAKQAEDAGQPEIDKNFFEVGLGLQYDINESFLVSLGFLHANTGVNQQYQSDLSFSLTSNTFGLGGAWKINDMFMLQLGGYYVTYDKSSYTYPNPNDAPGTYENSYLKSTWAISLGLDIAIGKK
jgi:long-subunit fatty acid transport protein